MSRLAVLEYPDPRLRTRAQPVTAFDAALQRLVADMFETMYAAHGIGLAASQVDVHLRVIVIDVSATASSPEVFINPRILSREMIGFVEESCLSLPGVLATVQRATRLRVSAQDAAGSLREQELDGVAAVCLQHEMDHLEGRLFVDHLSLIKRLGIRGRLGLRRRTASPYSETGATPPSA